MNNNDRSGRRLQTAHLLGSGRLLDDVARLRVPILVVVGAEDVITPPNIAEQVALALPASAESSSLPVLIEKSGHAVYLEEPMLVASLVERYLDGGRR